MKRRLWFIGLALALVLAVAMPATALAAKPAPFYATGTIYDITPGDVFPAGESGRWVVVERTLTGRLLDGELVSMDFSLTYKANVELASQAGNLHGTLETGAYVLKLNGKIEPYELVEIAPEVWLPKLTISGHWTFTEGARGQGDFDAWLIFVPTPQGHVDYILASEFTLRGKWKP